MGLLGSLNESIHVKSSEHTATLTRVSVSGGQSANTPAHICSHRQSCVFMPGELGFLSVPNVFALHLYSPSTM